MSEQQPEVQAETRASRATRGPSLGLRAVVSIALLIGFYVLVIAIAAVLIAAPVLEWRLLGQLHLYVLVLPVLGATLLHSLVPRKDEFTVPGPRFDERTQPGLMALVDRVAQGVGQPRPGECYLINDVNAFVTNRGGRLGIGGTRILAIGVPLMQQLDADELESVIAHEFGHFQGGDTRLGPVIYQTRAAIGRTLEASEGTVFVRLFEAYATLYLRVTLAISRAQEYAADRLASEMTDRATAARGLARIPSAAALHQMYVDTAFGPALSAPCRPPYLAGFATFLATDHAAEIAGQMTVATLGSATGSRYDSHPPIPDRITALGFDPSAFVDLPKVEVPAVGLLVDLDAVEHSLLSQWLVDDALGYPAVNWEEVPRLAYVPRWAESVEQHVRPHRSSLALAGLPLDLDGLDALGQAALDAAGERANKLDRERFGRHLARAWLATAAVGMGFEPVAAPGAPITFQREGATADLFGRYEAVLDGTATPEEFRRYLDHLGFDLESPSTIGSTPSDGPASGPSVPVTRGSNIPGLVSEPSGDADAPPALGRPVARVASAMSYAIVPRGQGLRTKKKLVIDGETLRWGDDTVVAGDVIDVAYQLRYEDGASSLGILARFTSPRGTVEIDITGTGSASRTALHDVLGVVVKWFERYVETRLVDERFAQLRNGETVDLAGVAIDQGGITVKSKRIAFSDLAFVGFHGKHVRIMKTADNLRGAEKVADIGCDVDNAVLLGPLVAMAAAEFG